MRIVSLSALAIAALSLGCDSQSTSPIDARPAVLSGAPVAPGGVLSLEYTNTTGLTYGVNPCRREVQALREGAWVALAPELRLCTDDMQLLEANVATTFEIDVPLGIADGTYRFKLEAIASQAPVDTSVHDIVTESFQVKQ